MCVGVCLHIQHTIPSYMGNTCILNTKLIDNLSLLIYLCLKRCIGECMFKSIFIVSIFLLGGCTLSIILTDTHGVATDVVDDTSKADADVSATANVPMSVLQKP
jgi:hypothetical protein